jgi:site-specific DNA-methyltransferase (adenine-specific)
MEKIKLTLILGDCLKILPTIPSESVDLVLTDPPYQLGEEEEKPTIIREGTKFKRKTPINPNFEWDKEVSLDWVKECYRILKKKGLLATFYGKDRISYLIDYAKKVGFKVRDIGGWYKTNPVPQARKVKWCSALEIWVLFRKEKGHTFNWKLGMFHNVIISPICQGNERTNHPTQKPEAVFKPFIEYFTNEGDTILDPFLGSGTTMKVARDLKRSCIGIEINPEYIEMTKKRLNWGSSLSDNIEWEFKDMSDLK